MHVAAAKASGNRIAVGLIDEDSRELRDFVDDLAHGPLPEGEPSQQVTQSLGTSSERCRIVKAAVVSRFGQPLTIEERTVPEPAAGEVLVRMETCGLCHTDIHAAHGD
jgi:hypothetical protein